MKFQKTILQQKYSFPHPYLCGPWKLQPNSLIVQSCLTQFSLFEPHEWRDCCFCFSVCPWRPQLPHLSPWGLWSQIPILFTHYSPWFFFFNKSIYFNWRIIALQYCDFFCHTLTWISRGYTCVHPPAILKPSPTPLPTISLCVVPEPWRWMSCFIHRTCTGHLFYIW